MLGRKMLLVVAVVFGATGCLSSLKQRLQKGERSALEVQLPEGAARGTVLARGDEPAAGKTQARLKSELQSSNQRWRELVGRVQVLEQKLRQLQESQQATDLQGIKDKLELFEKALLDLDTKLEGLKSGNKASGTSARLKKKSGTKRVAKAVPQKKGGLRLGPYARGERAFKQQKWAEAIEAYEQYKLQHPQGRMLDKVTYRLGVSFEKIGFIDQAKKSYEEVILKYPRSRWEKKAEYQLSLNN